MVIISIIVSGILSYIIASASIMNIEPSNIKRIMIVVIILISINIWGSTAWLVSNLKQVLEEVKNGRNIN